MYSESSDAFVLWPKAHGILKGLQVTRLVFSISEVSVCDNRDNLWVSVRQLPAPNRLFCLLLCSVLLAGFLSARIPSASDVPSLRPRRSVAVVRSDCSRRQCSLLTH